MGGNPIDLLGAVARIFLDPALSPQSVLPEVARALAECIDGSCTVRRRGPDGRTLELVASADARGPRASADAPQPARLVDAEPYASVLASGEMSVLETHSPGPPPPPGPVTEGLAAPDPSGGWLVVVPLRSPAGVIGTLAVFREGHDRSFGGDERVVLQEIADRCAQGVGAARPEVGDADAARAEVETAKLALEATLARFDTLLENAPIGLAFVDCDFRYRQINKSMAQINGLPLEAHLGRTVEETVPQLWPSLVDHLCQVIETRAPVVDLEVSGQTPAEPGVERHWLTSVYPVLDRGQRLQGVGLVTVEITERHRAERAARLLGGVSELLAVELDLKATVDAAARTFIPEFADGCVLCLVTPDREVEQLAFTCRDPESADIHLGYPETCPVELADGTVTGDLLAQGRSVIGERLDGYPQVDGFDELVRSYDAVSSIIVPMRSRRIFLGIVAFVYTHASERHYRSDDVVLAEQLAERLAQVIANVALAEQAVRAQARLQLLAQASTVVESELDVATRAGAIARLAVPQFADHASVFLNDNADGGLRWAGGAHRDPAVVARMQDIDWPVIDFDSPSAPATAVRSRETVLRPYQPNDGPARFLAGDHPELAKALATRSVLAVPLRSKDGPLGALFFAVATSSRRYGPEDVTLAEELARIAAPAISNALRFEQERITGETLQRSLLPRGLPDLAGVQVATRYLPGTTGLQVGGDWYDVVELDNGSVVLAIGDVVGHSIEAAVSMGRFRTVLQFSARQSRTPGEILGQINHFMCSAFENEMATVLVIVYDPYAGRAHLASAGHLPPVLIDAAGQAKVLAMQPGIPLGIDAHVAYDEITVEVDAGSALVLYTDGLIERRGETLDEGFARLLASGTDVVGDPGAIADRLLACVLPADGPDDDVALLVARLAIAGHHLDVEFPADTAVLAAARRDLRAWLRSLGAGEDEIGDVVLAVNEALANSIEHAYADTEPGRVGLTGALVNGSLTLTVSDQGRWRRPSGDTSRGRGIAIIRAVMDDTELVTTDAGARVTLHKLLRSTAAPVAPSATAYPRPLREGVR